MVDLSGNQIGAFWGWIWAENKMRHPYPISLHLVVIPKYKGDSYILYRTHNWNCVFIKLKLWFYNYNLNWLSGTTCPVYGGV